METVLPTFIELPATEQAHEIHQYLKSAGSDLSSNYKENLHEELTALLDASDNWLMSASDADLEALMNSFISLILLCNYDVDKLTKRLTKKLTDVGASQNNALLRLKILNNFFGALPENKPLRFDIYCGQLKLAAMFGLTDAITTQISKVKEWLALWNNSVPERRICYRMLHDALADERKSDEATKVMLELLGTYDEANAQEAKEDAKQCIVDFVGRPHVFLMDHLLKLGPVHALTGSPIHELLKIFVSGNLDNYMQFFNENQQCIKDLGLDHDRNITKMRYLTLVSIASQQNEISFEDLTKQLRLDEDDVEEFVIDAIKTKLVGLKLDQVNSKVLLNSSCRRTFERKEWEELSQRLSRWKNNLQSIRHQLEQVVTPAS